jgi:acetyltransferase-like isoleucine patch superfamily enzyme
VAHDDTALAAHSTASEDPVRATVRQILQAHDPALLLSAARLAGQVLRARFYLRRCTRVGGLTRLDGRPRILNGGTIVIGERVRIHSTTVPVELAAVNGGCIEIGDQSFLNYGVSISAFELVRIGRRCLLGTYVNILDNDWHDVVDRSRTPPSQPVILEDNVWLGNRVIVLPGVTIGHDAVVGAGSVVVKDVPPRSVAVGNPARVIRTF